MKKDTKESIIEVIIFVGGVTIFASLIGWVVWTEIVDYETVEGVIIDSEVVRDDDGSIKYIVVEFDDGSVFKIDPGESLDLTVNSRLILELSHKPNSAAPDVYTVDKVIKVPGDKE